MAVLVITQDTDVTADLVITELMSRGAEVMRFDLGAFPSRARLHAELRDGSWTGILSDQVRQIDLDRVGAVYWRRPGPPSPPAEMGPAESAWAAEEARYGLGGVLLALRCRWINHPARNAYASYKPVQLAAASQAGLRVPATLITNDAGHAAEFGERVGSLVYKTLSGSPGVAGQAIYTTPVEVDTLEGNGAAIAATAHTFQRQLSKQFEIRMTVVGDRLFSVRIDAHSEAAREDWRADHDALTYTVLDVPRVVASGVRRMMDSLGLWFAALDFVVDNDGRWLLIDLNSNGAWAWIAHETGLPIAAAIAEDLAEESIIGGKGTK